MYVCANSLSRLGPLHNDRSPKARTEALNQSNSTAMSVCSNSMSFSSQAVRVQQYMSVLTVCHALGHCIVPWYYYGTGTVLLRYYYDRSPMYALFSETLDGAVTIRAFDQEVCHRCSHVDSVYRLELMSCLVIFP